MKKITLIALLAISVIGKSQLNTEYQAEVKPRLFDKGYNGKNGAFAWGCIATSALLIGGTTQYMSTLEKAPSPFDYDDERKYNTAINNFEKNQRRYNTIFGVGVGVASISVIMVINDLAYYRREYVLNNKTSVSFKANPAGASIALNFK